MAGTLEIAKVSGAVILPTGLSLDDLKPSVLLAHELIKNHIPAERLMFALCRVGDRENEIAEARAYITSSGVSSFGRRDARAYRLPACERSG